MLIPFGVFSAAGAGGGAAAGAYELISTAYGTGSSGVITFDTTGLGSTYKHLQIRSVARTTHTSTQSAYVRLNGDTGSNYAFHTLEGNGSSVLSGAESSQTLAYMFLGGVPGTNSDAGVFEAGVTDILDFASSSKNTTIRTFNGTKGNIISNIRLTSGLWINTAAVTSITISTQNGSWTTTSRFSIYGIRG